MAMAGAPAERRAGHRHPRPVDVLRERAWQLSCLPRPRSGSERLAVHVSSSSATALRHSNGGRTFSRRACRFRDAIAESFDLLAEHQRTWHSARIDKTAERVIAGEDPLQSVVVFGVERFTVFFFFCVPSPQHGAASYSLDLPRPLYPLPSPGQRDKRSGRCTACTRRRAARRGAAARAGTACSRGTSPPCTASPRTAATSPRSRSGPTTWKVTVHERFRLVSFFFCASLVYLSAARSSLAPPQAWTAAVGGGCSHRRGPERNVASAACCPCPARRSLSHEEVCVDGVSLRKPGRGRASGRARAHCRNTRGGVEDRFCSGSVLVVYFAFSPPLFLLLSCGPIPRKLELPKARKSTSFASREGHYGGRHRD